MKNSTTIALALTIITSGCTPRLDTTPAQVPATAQVAAAPAASASTPAAAPAPAPSSFNAGPPACDNERAQDLVKETFIRRVLVEGDHALIERQALAPEEAFTESEIVEAMPRMLAMARIVKLAEQGYDAANERRRCVGQLAVDGWGDLAPPVSFQIVTVSDAARFGVASAVQLLPGAEGFNMLIGYRSTFGKAIKS